MRVEWRDIPGTGGAYEVSSAGQVRSKDRSGTDKRGRPRFRAGRLLRPGVTNEYEYVNIRLAGRHGSRKVHDLVTAAFIGPKPDGMQVRHLDGDRRNNNVDNLAYGTPKENMADAIAHGTVPRGQSHKLSKLTDNLVAEARLMRQGGITYGALADRFGVSEGVIRKAVVGETWAHVK
jgi:hypothetical protein